MKPKDMKILLVGWGYPPEIDGGLDIHVYHLFKELEKKDFKVKVALPEDRAPDKENIISLETGEGDMKWQARKISSEIVEISEEFDIIHTHDWFGAEAGFKAKKYSDTSWVSTIHSLDSSRNRSGSTDIGRLERVAVEEPDRLITVSKKLKDEIREEFRGNPEVIYNGFSKPSSTNKDVKHDLGIDNDMVFFVGRHAEQKGIEHLLYGFKKFLEDGNDASLVIGGDGHIKNSLEDFTEILGISDSVFFTGFIPREELGDYYGDADVFVSPSINEPFGLTITEALECETTVMATESGVTEILGENSIIEISPDSDSIKSGLEKALGEDFTSEYKSRSWKEMADETSEVYREIN